MSKKHIIVLLLHVLFVALLVLGTLYYLNTRLETTKIYVAKYDLTNRTQISESEIEEIEVPAYYLTNEVIKDKEEIVGKYVKINALIPKGSFFYKGVLDSIENMKDALVSELSNGEVSYDIPSNKINVNQAYLKKGMYVDLYLTINKDRVVSDLLINNIKIIGLYDINNKEIKDYDNESLLKTISFAIPKDSVNYLNKALVVGELNLVVGDNAYNDIKSSLNKTSSIFEYLD